MKTKKKLLCFCLLIMTIFAVSSTTFAAGGYVAKIGNKNYTSINKAIKDVERGQTIKLLKNASWSYPNEDGLTDKQFTLNLSRHILSLKNRVIIGNNTKITIKNGSIKGVQRNGYTLFEVGKYGSKNRSRLTFQSCKIKLYRRGFFVDTTYNADIVMKNSDLSFAKEAVTTAFNIEESSKLNVTGGHWTSGKSNNSIIENNGSVKISNLNHKGNSLLSTSGPATIKSGTYYLQDYYTRDLITVDEGGKLTISGGSFTSKKEGLICIAGGTMTMTGGTLHNIQVPVNNIYKAPSVSESGYYSPGHSGPVCIIIQSTDSKTVVNLKGGKVISNHGSCIYKHAESKAKVLTRGAACTPLAGASIIFNYSPTGK